MRSRLRRLFQSSGATYPNALANFTTEALAGAVRHDPTPLLLLLQQSLLIGLSVKVEAVQTQVAAPHGAIDLVVEVLDAGSRRQIWIEVKTRADEGSQLFDYQGHLQPFGDEIVPVTLARAPLRPEAPTLTWNALSRSARRSTSPLWADLRAFLQEMGLADEYEEPATRFEIEALGPAAALLRRAERILAPVAEHLNTAWKDSAWPADAPALREQLAAQFASHGRLAIHSRHRATLGFFVGLVSDDEGCAVAQVWGELPPKPSSLRRRAHEQARLLPASWERPAQGPVVVVRTPLVAGAPLVTITEWMKARANDLRAAGLFDLADRLREDAPRGKKQPNSSAPGPKQ